MSACIIFLLSLLFLLTPASVGMPAAAPSDPVVGDRVERVEAVLGSPKGRFTVGEVTVLQYDRGTVTCRSGAVIRVGLRPLDAPVLQPAVVPATNRPATDTQSGGTTAEVQRVEKYDTEESIRRRLREIDDERGYVLEELGSVSDPRARGSRRARLDALAAEEAELNRKLWFHTDR